MVQTEVISYRDTEVECLTGPGSYKILLIYALYNICVIFAVISNYDFVRSYCAG